MARALPVSEGSRLHRFSFFFVLLAQLWNLAPIVLAALFLGRSDRYDGWEIVGTGIAALALSLYSLIYTFSFRFWLLEDEIVIKKGFFDRTLRHIPFARISNLSHRQNLLHRIFGVVELNLESGASAQSEAKLTVLTKLQATALEQSIRAYHAATVREAAAINSAGDAQLTEPDAQRVEQLSFGTESSLLSQTRFSDLVRLGLISNRGMLLIGGSAYFLSQTGISQKSVFSVISNTIGQWVGTQHGVLFWLLTALTSILLIFIVVHLASIVVAIVQFHAFTLSRNGANLHTESGLLTRRGGQARIERVALVVIHNGWLYRLFSRQSVQVFLPGNAVSGDSMERSGMTHLTPVATQAHVHSLTEQIFKVQLSELHWNPLAPNAGRRMVKKSLFFGTLFWLPLLAFASFKLSHDLLAALCGCALFSFIWLYYSRHKDARESGYVLLQDFWIIKTGYFSQTIQLIRRDAIQSASLGSSHFDRTSAMANVRVDLMVSATTSSTKISYLHDKDAAMLFHALRNN